METWLFMFALAAPFVSVVGGLLLVTVSSMFTGLSGLTRRHDAAVPPLDRTLNDTDRAADQVFRLLDFLCRVCPL